MSLVVRCNGCGRVATAADAKEQEWMFIQDYRTAGTWGSPGHVLHCCSWACLGTLSIAAPVFSEQETA